MPEQDALDRDQDVAGSKRRSSWWQRTCAHLAELQSRLNTIKTGGLTEAQKVIADKADEHLRAARQAANRQRFSWDFTGSDIDRAFANMNKAEIKILRLTPEEQLRELGPYIKEVGRQHLKPDDQRFLTLEQKLNDNGYKITADMRELAVSVLLASQIAEEYERAQARSFRNILLASVVVTSIIAIGFIIWGIVDPVPVASKLCFTPDPPAAVCPVGTTPSGTDITLVEGFGAAAAAIAAAVSLRGIQGTSTPYFVPLMLMLLRLPVGALTALMGLVLIHGGFVPGLSNLDSSEQIVAWAIVFGIAQESVTRLVDDQGKKVLENVRGPSRPLGGDAPPEAPPEPQPG